MAANSMYVLEQGLSDEKTKRPVSGRRSANKVPLKRSGSSLEVIQPNDDGDKKTTNVNGATGTTSRTSSRSSSRTTTPNLQERQSSSAGSADRKSDVLTPTVLKNARKMDERSSSADAKMERCDSPKKQVFLPSVRRNFEQHGMPKDETLATMLRENMTSPQEQAAIQSNHSNSEHGNKTSKRDIDALMQRLSMKVEGNQIDGERPERKRSGKKKSQSVESSSSADRVTDAYYISHGDDQPSTSKEVPDEHPSKVTAIPNKTASKDTLPSKPPPPSCDTGSYYISHGASLADDDDENQDKKADAKEESEEESSDEDSEDEGPKAPFELLGEFLEAVMDEEWEDAEKLCKMVLIYEPDNVEGNQFKPLIEEMLRREREHQLFGSDSDEDSDDDDDEDSDDDDEDEDDEDDDDDDDDDESSSTESESENEPTAQDVRDKEEAKKDRESKMMNAINNVNHEPR